MRQEVVLTHLDVAIVHVIVVVPLWSVNIDVTCGEGDYGICLSTWSQALSQMMEVTVWLVCQPHLASEKGF